MAPEEGKVSSPTAATKRSLSSRDTSPAPAASTATTFFRLPAEIRRVVYKLVLVVRHPIYLFWERSRVHRFGPEIPRRWLALLHVSRQMHGEASAVAYGSNKFTLVDMTKQADILQPFLDGIGSANASFLSHLTIGFPAMEAVDGQPGKAKLSDDDLRVLGLVSEKCAGLTTLETQVYNARSAALRKADDGSSLIAEDAFSQIDAQLRAIPSLRKFMAVVYDMNIDPSITELMKRHGWVVHLYGR